MPDIVKTITRKCRKCYACIRECPVKAIKVINGQAQVIQEKCIHCGHCVEVCTQQAKLVRCDVEKVEAFINSGPTIACLAPSFVPEFYPASPGQLVNALKQIGFTEVHEVAFGADLVTQEGLRYLAENSAQQGFISTPCPAVVNLVTKYYPRLIPRLVPVVSPMIALARYLKHKAGSEKRIVFIGPCVAKKGEAEDEEVAGVVDAVLTFLELKEMLASREINVHTCANSAFDSEPAYMGRLYPVGGGLHSSAGIDDDILKNEAIVVAGWEDCLAFLEAADEGKAVPHLVDILFCKGCINGPMQENKFSSIKRRQLVADYTRQGLKIQPQPRPVKLEGISLRREFNDRHIVLSRPSEKDIRAILAELGKYGPEDELNCGACGYPTCREKAIAVYNGEAENRMCLPYLIASLEKSNLFLRQELNVYSRQYDELIGNSEAMQEVYYFIDRVAKTEAVVLIKGEVGTNKGLVARAIHYNSLRAQGPFVELNCAVLPENLLERELFGYVEEGGGSGSGTKGLLAEAHKGTIYIEDIGEMSLRTQKKFSQVLRDGEYFRLGEMTPERIDVRVIVGCSQDLEEALKQQSFLPELYYQLNAITIRVPPVRERRDDIPLMARYFKDKVCERLQKKLYGFTDEAMDALIRYDWPGNEREMENVIERAVILAEAKRIELGDLPRRFRSLAAGARGWAYT
ncbi:MAG: sigma 54-interacting transcriptional regulator, partial [Clostridia bacterium]|nr:sigma 54-interacting transcriptional regulator [Clostridia bacterium]